MTNPAVATFKRHGSRYYRHPTSGEVAPGVTSIISQLPKPFLVHWAAKMTAEAAYDDFSILAAFIGKGDRDGATKHLKGARYKTSDAAASRGSDVHDIVEKIFSGKTPRIHPDFQGFIDGFNAFVDIYNPEPILLERSVWSSEHNFAGTFDALLKFNDGRNMLIDYKTSKSVYPEVGLQLAAYANAEGVIPLEGDQLEPMPQIDGYGVLWLRPDRWAFHELNVTDETFQTFLALRKSVFVWETEAKDQMVERPAHGEVFGEGA